jgi:hypothetical protein
VLDGLESVTGLGQIGFGKRADELVDILRRPTDDVADRFAREV